YFAAVRPLSTRPRKCNNRPRRRAALARVIVRHLPTRRSLATLLTAGDYTSKWKLRRNTTFSRSYNLAP
ncbi:MAG: hypothetical protein ACRD7E_22980, partial [Bryobacteraceae bacterium]